MIKLCELQTQGEKKLVIRILSSREGKGHPQEVAKIHH